MKKNDDGSITLAHVACREPPSETALTLEDFLRWREEEDKRMKDELFEQMKASLMLMNGATRQ